MKIIFILLFSIIFVQSFQDEKGAGKRVLVLLDNLDIKLTHSIFLKSLEERGYELTYATSNDQEVTIRNYGEWKYDNIILFSPSIEDLEGVTEKDFIDFIDEGHNMLIAADSNIGSLMSSIASECNVEFDDPDSFVIDHLNFDVSDYDGKHDIIVVENVVDAPIVIGANKIEAPILFRGIAQDIDEDSPVLFPILSGYSSTYSSSLTVTGKKTILMSALQARNNARVIFSGSLELFSDKFFNSPVQKFSVKENTTKYEKSGNENFAKQIARWAFQERGILRVKSVKHHLVGETISPAVYTIKDDIEYSIEVEEWKGTKWVPFVTSDLQLEFIMLDPYVRTSLKSDNNGKFTTQFKIPDVYGIFTFKVEYSRKGYGYIRSIERTPVRPFRHNQYERFIASAYPYYASAFSMMIGLFIFSWFFLYNKQK